MKLKIIVVFVVLFVVFGVYVGDVDWGMYFIFLVLVGVVVIGNFFDIYLFLLVLVVDVMSSVLLFGNMFGGSYSVWFYGIDGMFGIVDDLQLGLWGMSVLFGLVMNYLLLLSVGSYYYVVGGCVLFGGVVYVLLLMVVVVLVLEFEIYVLLGVGLGIIGFVVLCCCCDY